jgi:predicted DNA binding CopG/RHH family protein
MKEKTIYTNAPENIRESIDNGEKVIDFLPPPNQLIRKIPKVKITITLNSQSVNFFKQSAKKNKVKYQTMINEVLDQYARLYSNNK